MDGRVLEAHRGGFYKVEFKANGAPVLARARGRMARARIRIIAGDRVTVELTPHDAGRGRIVRRG